MTSGSMRWARAASVSSLFRKKRRDIIGYIGDITALVAGRVNVTGGGIAAIG